uniref:Viral IAP-associated factor homolog n=2 Tax=Nicotiana TaxID=4085 RepID=A0A1S4CQR1_TOBAC|nr:PREDICTED: viral IAP-associated factor homolog [Nicotiana sylvestris]XP_016503401.1 PREDICTED: viral IAP-associated factor homolog [Nicotiana tabacum]
MREARLRWFRHVQKRSPDAPKDVEGASTQWDDIQRKLGNHPPKPPAFKPPPFTPETSNSKPKDKDWIDEKTQDELDELEDDPQLNDDRFLQEYRKKKLAEIREAAKIARFGAVLPISGSHFVREVSQAPDDTWVVVLLYKDGYSGCQILLQCLEELAMRYPATKFVKIISTDCISNYPDRNLPTVLVYNNGALKSNYVGLHNFGRRCIPEVMFSLCLSLAPFSCPSFSCNIFACPGGVFTVCANSFLSFDLLMDN